MGDVNEDVPNQGKLLQDEQYEAYLFAKKYMDILCIGDKASNAKLAALLKQYEASHEIK